MTASVATTHVVYDIRSTSTGQPAIAEVAEAVADLITRFEGNTYDFAGRVTSTVNNGILVDVRVGLTITERPRVFINVANVGGGSAGGAR